MFYFDKNTSISKQQLPYLYFFVISKTFQTIVSSSLFTLLENTLRRLTTKEFKVIHSTCGPGAWLLVMTSPGEFHYVIM